MGTVLAMKRLQQHEQKIEKTLTSISEGWRTIADEFIAIRDEGEWREEYGDDWHGYVRGRWGSSIDRAKINNLIRGRETEQDLRKNKRLQTSARREVLDNTGSRVFERAARIDDKEKRDQLFIDLADKAIASDQKQRRIFKETFEAAKKDLIESNASDRMRFENAVAQLVAISIPPSRMIRMINAKGCKFTAADLRKAGRYFDAVYNGIVEEIK